MLLRRLCLGSVPQMRRLFAWSVQPASFSNVPADFVTGDERATDSVTDDGAPDSDTGDEVELDINEYGQLRSTVVESLAFRSQKIQLP